VVNAGRIRKELRLGELGDNRLRQESGGRRGWPDTMSG
jgi:hypothetical protein